MRLSFIFFCLLPIIAHAQIITTFAGGATGHGGYWGEGAAATSAQLSAGAYAVVSKHGNIYIADRERVLKVDPSSGIITTVAGTGVQGYNGDGIPAASAQISGAGIVAFDNTLNSLTVGDGGNNRYRRVPLSTGLITNLVGNGILGSNGDGGPATAAAITGGAMAHDHLGNFYFGCKRKIRKVNALGIVSTVAGTGLPGFTGEGVQATATNMQPNIGIAVDKLGNIYFSDTTGAVRKITISTGVVTRVAGTGDNLRNPYSGDNIPATTCHIAPLGIAVDDAGNLYIADGVNNRIEKVDIFGVITTVAGNGTSGFDGDGGPATAAKLSGPQSVSLDTCGNLYIADFNNSRIRKVTFPKCGYLDVKESVVAHHVAKLQLYPNPAYNELTITGVEKMSSVCITNTVGQGVITTHYKGVEKAEVDIRHLPAGVYMVQVTDVDGQKMNGKFVKEP